MQPTTGKQVPKLPGKQSRQPRLYEGGSVSPPALSPLPARTQQHAVREAGATFPSVMGLFSLHSIYVPASFSIRNGVSSQPHTARPRFLSLHAALNG